MWKGHDFVCFLFGVFIIFVVVLEESSYSDPEQNAVVVRGLKPGERRKGESAGIIRQVFFASHFPPLIFFQPD